MNLLIVCILISVVDSLLANPSVQTHYGTILGSIEDFEGHQVERYLGIPFAQPPIGQLRFQKPAKLIQSLNVVLNATKWPNSCLQSNPFLELLKYKSSIISEDCLYLNVWKPVVSDQAKTKSSLKPVLVYIYGGSFYIGSSSQLIYNGLPLAALGQVVMVTLNYRLGALGFVNGGHRDTPGNLAIHDQLAALNWIKDNIENFGGDPSRVTVFGESAGSISVGVLLFSPLAKDLFTNAILMSGSPMISHQMIKTKQESIDITLALAEKVGCQSKSKIGQLITRIRNKVTESVSDKVIDCLRTINGSDILKAQSEILTEFSMPYSPYVGDDVFPLSPSDALQKNQFKTNFSLMVGVVTYEGSIVEDDMRKYPELVPLLSNGTKQQWRDALVDKIRALPNKVSNVEGVADFYFNSIADDPETSRQTFATAMGDYFLGCPTLLTGEKLAKASDDVRAYGYHFSYKSDSRGTNNGYNVICKNKKGVCHATELQYVFGYPLIATNEEFHDQDTAISREMIKIWTDFAKTGETEWPSYFKAATSVVPMNYELNPLVENKVTNDYNYLKCKLWEPFLF